MRWGGRGRDFGARKKWLKEEAAARICGRIEAGNRVRGRKVGCSHGMEGQRGERVWAGWWLAGTVVGRGSGFGPVSWGCSMQAPTEG